MKVLVTLVALSGMIQLVQSQNGNGIVCSEAFGITEIPNNKTTVNDVLGSMIAQTSRDAASGEQNSVSSDVTSYVQDSNATSFDAYTCTYKASVLVGDGVAKREVIQAYSVCPHNVTDPSQCVAVAVYNDTQCASASLCEGGAYEADCSGISPNHPNCKVTCDGTGLAYGIESCVDDTFGTSSAWRMGGVVSAGILSVLSVIL
jgi:hypothetical protein